MPEALLKCGIKRQGAAFCMITAKVILVDTTDSVGLELRDPRTVVEHLGNNVPGRPEP